MRVKMIGYRIAVANSRNCARPDLMSGIIVHDITQYAPPDRAAVLRAFPLTDGFGILQIVPGSAADRAGLKINDEIIKIDYLLFMAPWALQQLTSSYSREEQFTQILSDRLSKGAAWITVRRAGQLVRIPLRGEPGCGGDVMLSNSSDLNAWSDGRRVMITTAMMKHAPETDELAFVIAHEMAHNILAQGSGDSGAMGIFEMLGFGSRDAIRNELDADRYAVILMNSAGYSPQGAIDFLRSVRRWMWWTDWSINHPTSDQRMDAVAGAIARLSQRGVW